MNTRKGIHFLEAFVTRYPRAFILTAFALAIFGAYLYFFKLEIISDRKQLINRDIPSNQRYLNYIDEFGDNELLVLVVQAVDSSSENSAVQLPTPTQRSAMKNVAKHWVQDLRKRPDMFPQVIERITWQQEGSAPLFYLEIEELRKLFNPIIENEETIRNLATRPSLDHLFETLNETLVDAIPTDGDGRQDLGIFIQKLADGISALSSRMQGHHFHDFDTDSLFANIVISGKYDPDGFFFSNNDKILTAYANVRGDPAAQNRYAELMRYAKQSLNIALQTVSGENNIRAGIAGMPALEQEELETTRRDFARGAVLAIVLVTVLFIIVFRDIWRPALAAICLCLVIAITFVFAYFTVGHLSLLVMIFTVILVALGVDFAIHFLTHYEKSLQNLAEPNQAIHRTYASVGGALWMGGLTTAAAFFSAYFTEFVGLSELGVVAGGGLLISILLMYFVYPAMLFVLDTKMPSLRIKLSKKPAGDLSPGNHILSTAKKSARWIFGGFMFLIIAGFLFGQYYFDTNLLKLQSVDGEANKWQNILIKNDDRSLFAASTFDNRADLEAMRPQFENMSDIIRKTETLFPYEEEIKHSYLDSVYKTLAAIEMRESQSSLFNLRRQVSRLRQQIRKFQGSNDQAKKGLTDLSNAVSELYRILQSEDKNELQVRLGAADSDLSKVLRRVKAAAIGRIQPQPIQESQIPLVLKDQFTGSNGRVALRIYPKKNAWEREALEEFVRAVRQVDANIVGELISLHDNGNSIIRSFLMASIYSLTAILFLLYFWTRSIKKTVLSILPLISCVAILLFTMKRLPIEWNFTNFFALPILIGTSVDSGIHLVQAWQSDEKTFMNALKAVTLSTTTTMIGFGVLATSEHAGVSSLGLVLFIGISACLISSVTLLTASLRLFLKRG